MEVYGSCFITYYDESFWNYSKNTGWIRMKVILISINVK
jgi:hypothetical protein